MTLTRFFRCYVDAIDNIKTKVQLLKYCALNNIKVFSSMGAGAKADPTRVQIADLSATHYDPLARAVRQKLRAALAGSSGTCITYFLNLLEAIE